MAHTATVSTVNAKVKDAVDSLRSAAQELNKEISDAAAKKSGATKADFAALAEKAKGVAQSAKASMDSQHANVTNHMKDAVKHLEATQASLADSMKAHGAALDTSVKKVIAEARASVQKISEAVAAKRAANSAKK
jgi:hypothetical protein